MTEHSKKRIALVTGANKGIGYETARQLASHGISVLIGARDEQRGKEAAAKLQGNGLDVQFLHLDVNDQTTHEAARRFIEHNFGRLDILVNNAGVALDATQKPSEVDMQTLRKTFDTNFFGTATKPSSKAQRSSSGWQLCPQTGQPEASSTLTVFCPGSQQRQKKSYGDTPCTNALAIQHVTEQRLLANMTWTAQPNYE